MLLVLAVSAGVSAFQPAGSNDSDYFPTQGPRQGKPPPDTVVDTSNPLLWLVATDHVSSTASGDPIRYIGMENQPQRPFFGQRPWTAVERGGPGLFSDLGTSDATQEVPKFDVPGGAYDGAGTHDLPRPVFVNNDFHIRLGGSDKAQQEFKPFLLNESKYQRVGVREFGELFSTMAFHDALVLEGADDWEETNRVHRKLAQAYREKFKRELGRQVFGSASGRSGADGAEVGRGEVDPFSDEDPVLGAQKWMVVNLRQGGAWEEGDGGAEQDHAKRLEGEDGHKQKDPAPWREVALLNVGVVESLDEALQSPRAEQVRSLADLLRSGGLEAEKSPCFLPGKCALILQVHLKKWKPQTVGRSTQDRADRFERALKTLPRGREEAIPDLATLSDLSECFAVINTTPGNSIFKEHRANVRMTLRGAADDEGGDADHDIQEIHSVVELLDVLPSSEPLSGSWRFSAETCFGRIVPEVERNGVLTVFQFPKLEKVGGGSSSIPRHDLVDILERHRKTLNTPGSGGRNFLLSQLAQFLTKLNREDKFSFLQRLKYFSRYDNSGRGHEVDLSACGWTWDEIVG